MNEKSRTTDIGDFPSTWKIDRVDSAFEIQQGKQVSKKNRMGDNQRPFLRTKNILWDRLELSDLDQMNFTEADECRLRLRPNDLLTCEGGDIGRTALWSGEIENCYYQNHLHRLRALDGKADAQFSVYWFWYAFQVAKLYFGRGNVTTIPNLSRSKLAELPMVFPPLPEQKKIAHILSTVQQAIEAQEKIIQTTTELKKALMHKLFTEGTRSEPQKETEIGLVPESWELVPLKSVASKPQYGITATAARTGDAKFLRITDITDKGVNWDSVPFCVVSQKDFERCRLESGDIVFARIGATTGKSYLIKDAPASVFASYLIRVRSGNALIPGYLIQFFQSAVYWEQINANKHANLKKGVNASILSNLMILLPPLSEQEKIAEVFDKTENRICSARSTQMILHDTFRTILHKLMTAKVRVQEFRLKGRRL